MVLIKSGKGYSGYLATDEQSKKITGSLKEEVLTLTLAEGNDKTESYAALDENGNLLVTDEQFNMVYFIRTEANVSEVIAGIEGTTAAATTKSAEEETSKTPAAAVKVAAAKPAKGRISAKYANKKFLHMYTGNGLSEKWAYYLFDNGQFYYRNFTTYHSDNAYSNFSTVMSSNDAGTWAVEVIQGVEYLNFNWNDGKTGQLRIQKAEVGYLLNNNKYYLVNHNEYE